MLHPVALLVMGGGAYATNRYLDGETYIPDGIAEPQIGGFNARYIIGGLGLVASVMTGGLVGLLGAGAAVGSLLNAQTAKEVQTVYQKAVITYEQRQLIAQRNAEQRRLIAERDVPITGYIEPRGGSEVMGSSYIPAMFAA